jgi:two-component system KDP operon response regulator KdpE
MSGLSPTETRQSGAYAPSAGSAAAGLILVVEDERHLREPLEYLLRMRNFDVLTAATADEALELLHLHKPDAAIVDLVLKQGSGRDVIVRVPSPAPVIIFSATVSASGQLERLRPRTRLIEKPCSLSWLVNTLDEMLASSREVATH